MEPNLIGWHPVGLGPGYKEQTRFSELIGTSPTGTQLTDTGAYLVRPGSWAARRALLITILQILHV